MVFLGSFVSALVDVLAIIGIIIVGGFLIFFLGDLVLSVLDPDYKRFGKKEKTEEKVEEVKKLPAATEKVEALGFVPEEKVEEEFTFAEEPAKEEVNEIEKAKEDALSDLRAEEENFKANMLKAIEERKAQKQETKENEFNQFFFDDEDLSVFDNQEETNEENEDEFNGLEIEPEEETQETVEEVEEQPEQAEETVNSEVEDLKKQLEEERRKFEEEKLALINANDELAKKLEENGEVVQTAPAGSLEDYEARLEELKARLANNEKELRKVKKEFLPLRKVARTLESDERKLRRKEAIVAKQKVVLYGVNNIGEIDEEKAKKLEEDLDILEGFRLSVQHCQEVMNANKERYPILENTYNILTENTEIIKKDIAEVEENIAKLKNDNE